MLSKDVVTSLLQQVRGHLNLPNQMSNLTLDIYVFLSHSTINGRNVLMSFEFKINLKIVGNKYEFLIICKLKKLKL